MPTLDVPVADLVRHRRHFHQHPELSFEEVQTAAYIERALLDAGFASADLRTGVAKTGILATLVGGKPGPVTLLRADMDGLPVAELSEVEYRSKREGVMHACGHDGHMAILLTAACELIKRRDEIAGTIVFCFQPAEEGPAGARVMIEEGALENPHVDRTFALHLYSGLDVGRVGIRDGAFFAASDRFEILLSGKGGHGAMPQTAIDPVVGASHLVTLLQTIPSREIAPKDPVVVTVGAVHAGTTFNVIPETAQLLGTVRTMDEEVRRGMPERMERIVEGLCDGLRLNYEFEYHWGYPPTVNDPAMNAVVHRVAQAAVGEDAIDYPHEIVMWGEDMSFMQQERPGAYFIVGVRGPELGHAAQHSAYYDIDERALEVGYKMMVGIALAG